MTIELLSTSAQPSEAPIAPKKKSKKSKTQETGETNASNGDRKTDIMKASGDGTAEDDLRKKEKKEKKKKRKHRDQELTAESVEGTGTSTPIELEQPVQGESSMPRKDKKRKRKVEPIEVDVRVTPSGGEPMQVDDSEEKSSSEKKKAKKEKRKHRDAAGDSIAEGSRKKAKRSKQEDSPPDVSSEAQTADPTSEKKSKKAKKDKSKKEKRQPESQESISASPSSSSPASSLPTTPPSEDDISTYLSTNSITIHSPSSHKSNFVPVLNFSQLQIPTELRGAFKGFKEPTPIQACSWPPALEGKDVIGIAETGSGKTLAFGIPALARLLTSKGDDPKPKVLVVAPTRELAIQTHDCLLALGEPFGIKSVALFGGVDKSSQIQALKRSKSNKSREGVKVLVGTPGRILDLVNDGSCDLSGVDYLVLDEADRMLDKGFENDIRAIIGHTRTNTGGGRQTLMFSATWPEAVRRLASSFLKDPVRVVVGTDDLSANRRVQQVVEVFDDARSKDSRLLGHLQKYLPKRSKPSDPPTLVLVFALYKKEAARVESMLKSKGYSVGGLHGDLSQNARMDALQNFKSGQTRILVATDVAARGLDIPNVELVINYTFPLTVEDYVHRIGRTGRGGKHGKSITFFTGDIHERSLAGELARVLRESGFEDQVEGLKKFPMTIKKKTHGAYGAFYRDDIPTPTGPTKITFD